ncbi:hypothetical protein [Deinococcus aestuarii]|uniref:hypothetical protein n=1 Tax=Deinococcus aestuarii TaxID=2774531 RepID=UPI001C0BC475|nr:hypothetical protein [Deinococcus aestuarii]
MPRSKAPRAQTVARPTPAASPVTFRAGCAREWVVASAEPDLAYTEQAFPECPACPHRVEPEETRPFCTLRPVGTAHPFAALAGLDLPE